MYILIWHEKWQIQEAEPAALAVYERWHICLADSAK
jgi:hypothetical protein